MQTYSVEAVPEPPSRKLAAYDVTLWRDFVTPDRRVIERSADLRQDICDELNRVWECLVEAVGRHDALQMLARSAARGAVVQSGKA